MASIGHILFLNVEISSHAWRMSKLSPQNFESWIFPSPIQYEYFHFSISSQVYIKNLQKNFCFVLTVLALLLSYGHFSKITWYLYTQKYAMTNARRPKFISDLISYVLQFGSFEWRQPHPELSFQVVCNALLVRKKLRFVKSICKRKWQWQN